MVLILDISGTDFNVCETVVLSLDQKVKNLQKTEKVYTFFTHREQSWVRWINEEVDEEYSGSVEFYGSLN